VENNILLEAQNGFRKNKSTNTAGQTCIESIQEASDRTLHAIGIFFAPSKAYDIINHDMLLDKLNSYVTRGESNLWFKSYLSNQLQIVEIKGTDSSNSFKKLHFVMNESGASCTTRLSFGPLLFLLYAKDHTENVQGTS
jgi:hypothetical protein